MKKDNILCPFCTETSTCIRHKDKNAPKDVKAKVTIPKVSAKKKGKLTEEKERKERLKVFFDEKIQDRPEKCQNCEPYLLEIMFPQPRSIIAHLLPKRLYHSVETHDYNFIYLCISCHNRFDLQTSRFLKESKTAPLILERVKQLYPLLTQQEQKILPEYLYPQKYD